MMKKIIGWINSIPYKKYDPLKVFILQTTHEGKIVDFAGHEGLFFNVMPKKNADLVQSFHQFEGLFPFRKNQLSFPNIETRENVYANIDIYSLDDNVLIVFEDNSDYVSSVRTDVQKANEKYLRNYTKYKILSDDEIPVKDVYTEILYYLNVGIFQYDCKGKVKFSGKQPGWLYELKPELFQVGNNNLAETFPFLEIFFPEFDQFCRINSSGKLGSDLWTEVDVNGNERLLQCIGIKTMNIAWLLLLSHDTVLTRDRNILQKAREQTLFTEQLAKAKNELQKLLDFKDQFVSIVSHDLRSPISSVVAATDMMLMDYDFRKGINDLYFEFIETINKDMKLLLDYNEKLYYWSNLQLGRFNLVKRTVDIAELLSATKSKLDARVKEKSIVLEVITNENLFVEADESLITQVIVNLVNNAIKFTPEGGKVLLTGEKQDDRILLKVTDTGIGIRPEVLQNLFKGYVKDHADGTNGEKGSGLGLGICKRIIDAHGFQINAESVVKSGTTFTITF